MIEQPTNLHLLQHVVLAADDVRESRSGMEQRAVLAEADAGGQPWTFLCYCSCPRCTRHATQASAGENDPALAREPVRGD